MNTPIPAGMTIIDNRREYIEREFDVRWASRMAMPPKTRELATLNRSERVSKSHKFQMNLRINRAMKKRKTVIAKAKAIGITGSELQ